MIYMLTFLTVSIIVLFICIGYLNNEIKSTINFLDDFKFREKFYDIECKFDIFSNMPIPKFKADEKVFCIYNGENHNGKILGYKITKKRHLCLSDISYITYIVLLLHKDNDNYTVELNESNINKRICKLKCVKKEIINE